MPQFKIYTLICALYILINLVHVQPIHAATQVCATQCISTEIVQYCASDYTYSPNISVSSKSKGILNHSTAVVAAKEVVNLPEPTMSQPTTSTIPSPKPEPTPIHSDSPFTLPEEPVVIQATSGSGNLDSVKLLDLINQHRQSLNLTPFQTDDRLCAIAKSRAPELNNEIFGDAYVHQGFNSQDHGYWITENMVHQPSEAAALNWWLSSSLHRRAIESSIHTHSCGICSGHTCIQLFTSWQPR